MDLFLDFPLTTLFVLGLIAWITTAVVRRRNRDGGRATARGAATCPQCGAAVPPVARFCRNCGHAVSG